MQQAIYCQVVVLKVALFVCFNEYEVKLYALLNKALHDIDCSPSVQFDFVFHRCLVEYFLRYLSNLRTVLDCMDNAIRRRIKTLSHGHG